jgi:hypothetical protein
MPNDDRESVLWINDTPKRTEQHGHYYDPDKMHVVAVTYVTASHHCTRVSFDPHTGVPSIQQWTEADDA